MNVRLNHSQTVALAILAIVTSTLVPARAIARADLASVAPWTSPTGAASVHHPKEAGLQASLGDAVRKARLEARALPSGDAFALDNPETGWSATFDTGAGGGTRVFVPGGASPRTLALRVAGFGYGRHLLTLTPQSI